MIGLDSWILMEIYTKGAKFEKAKGLMDNLEKGGKAVISTMAITEIKYKASKIFGRTKANRFIREILTFPNTEILPVSVGIAINAANLRLKYYKRGKELSYADCIHLATSIASKCNKFYSGDPDFEGITEIPVEIV